MFVHIGLPKCASTSLQQSFAAMNNACFLGCDPKADLGGFYKKELGFLIEKELRLGAQDEFVAQKKHLSGYLLQQNTAYNGRCILSYENLSLCLTPYDVPTDMKYQRLSSILPKSSNIIFVYRPVRAFLISLYKNYLQMGYANNLERFVRDIIESGTDGILGDITLQVQHERLLKYFDRQDIHFFDLANLRSSLDRFFSKYGMAFTSLRIENTSLQDGYVLAALSYNKAQHKSCGEVNWLELHRIYHQGEVPDDLLFKASRYRHTLDAALSKQSICEDSVRYIQDFEWPEEILLVEDSNMTFLDEAV